MLTKVIDIKNSKKELFESKKEKLEMLGKLRCEHGNLIDLKHPCRECSVGADKKNQERLNDINKITEKCCGSCEYWLPLRSCGECCVKVNYPDSIPQNKRNEYTEIEREYMKKDSGEKCFYYKFRENRA